MDITTTLKIRSNYLFNVTVTKDIVAPPYNNLKALNSVHRPVALVLTFGAATDPGARRP